jgi:hypothetical protein
MPTFHCTLFDVVVWIDRYSGPITFMGPDPIDLMGFTII